jgi:uncharacterized protein (TIGR02453 family)
MNAKLILTFLKDLENNNDREWFHANKSRYENAKKEFETFANTIIPEIAKFDKDIINLSAKDCLFRIYNDIRFAKNKPLYKTNMGAYIANGGKNSGHAGYYIHIENNNCFLGGGIYMPPPDKLKLIRQEIYYNYKEFSNILSSKSLKKYFQQLDDFKVSRVPKEFPKDCESAELLKYKSYTLLCRVTQKQLLSEDYKSFIIDVFKTITPLNHFINRALFVPQDK